MEYIKRNGWRYVLVNCEICKDKAKHIRIDQWNKFNQTWKCGSCACVLRNKKHPHIIERLKETRTLHGDAKNKTSKGHWLYGRWQKMKRRCKEYPTYIAKNISVCKSWVNDYKEFKTWALANGASRDLELDRIDNFGDYCPENCRWVTHRVNCQNR